LQYRELKAREAEAQTKSETKVEQVAQPVVETKQEETKQIETKQEETKQIETKQEEVQKINIDGVGEITLEELKNGYLRQNDYTQRLQDVTKKQADTEDAIKFFNLVKQNPELAEEIKTKIPVPPSIDPTTSKLVELESHLYDVMLDSEITKLQGEFKDFEVREVLKTAKENGLTDLRNAYLLNKSLKGTPDPNQLKEQLRQQILQEIETEKNGTQTIIGASGGAVPVSSVLPSISPAEQKVARGQGLTDAEYIKWRDADRTPKK